MLLVVNLFVIAYIIYKGYMHSRSSELRGFFVPALLVKLVAGIAVGMLYKYYYDGGDTFSLFEAAMSLKDVGFSSWQNFVDIYLRSRYDLVPDFQYSWIPTPLFIKILSLFALLTGDNYWLTSIYFSLINFFSFWLWARALVRLTSDRWLAVLSALFVPSLVFWTSGILKETLAIAILAVLLAWISQGYYRNEYLLRHIIPGIVLLFFLALLKFFIAGILLTAVLSLYATTLVVRQRAKWYIEAGIYSLFFMLLGFAVSMLHPNLWPSRIAEVIYTNYAAYETLSSSEGLLVFKHLAPDLLSVLISMPKAIVAGLYFPLSPISGSPLSIFFVFENWLLILGTLAIFYNRHIINNDKLRKLIWAAIIYVIVSAGLIALTTPNPGTLSRYKTSYMILMAPFIINGIITLFRKRVQKP